MGLKEDSIYKSSISLYKLFLPLLTYKYIYKLRRLILRQEIFTSIFAAFGSIWQHLAAKYAIRAPRAVAYGIDQAAAKCRI